MSPSHYLILIKHSLPEIAEDVPAKEWSLSGEGRIRAKRLVERLKPFHPEVIFSSVEPKAQQTAEIIADGFGLKFAVVHGLHEHDRTGASFYSKNEFESLVQKLFEKPNRSIFGNETGLQALDRFRESVEVILESSSGKILAIVSHGTVIALFVSWLTGADGYLLWMELGLPSFVVLDIQKKKLLEIVNIS